MSDVGLLDVKPESKPQARHQNETMKNISSSNFSQQISGKEFWE